MLGVTKAIGGLPTVNIRLHQYSINRKLKTLLKKPLFSGCFLYAYHAPSLQNCIPGLLMVTSHISFQRNHFPVNPKSIRAKERQKKKDPRRDLGKQVKAPPTDRRVFFAQTHSSQEMFYGDRRKEEDPKRRRFAVARFLSTVRKQHREGRDT